MKNTSYMIKYLVYLLSLFICSNIIGQSKNNYIEVVNKSILKAKEMSLYSDEVNWDSLSNVIIDQTKNANSYLDLKLPLTTLLNGLRDHHGTFYYNNKRLANFTDFKKTRKTDLRKTDMKIWKEVNYHSHHEYKLIDDTVGYVKIVGIGPVDIIAKSKIIRAKIDSLAIYGAKKWIIDLRYNGGGNWHPMLEALAPILGDGTIGGDADSNGDLIKSSVWKIDKSNFVYGNLIAVELPKSKVIKKNSKVAILTSRYTVSSGEAVVTAFKGRENTIFIGETTGGYTTVNNMEAINSEISMSISVTYYSDRDGKVYKENLQPDIEVEFKLEKNYKKDKGILKAIEWLEN